MYRKDVTLTEALLGLLTYYGGGSRVMWRYVSGQIPANTASQRFVLTDKKVSDASVRTTLHRLQKKGMVEKAGEAWHITSAGRSFLRECLNKERLPRHSKKITIKKKSKHQMIVMFDIPESHKRVRNWLRIELALLGFEILQKSVWLGPTPLPREFIEKLTATDILQFIHFFRVTKEDVA